MAAVTLFPPVLSFKNSQKPFKTRTPKRELAHSRQDQDHHTLGLRSQTLPFVVCHLSSVVCHQSSVVAPDQEVQSGHWPKGTWSWWGWDMVMVTVSPDCA